MQNGHTSTPQATTSDETVSKSQVANGHAHIDRPPDLPHITERFIPIAHIALVLARSAYTDLTRLRQSLADLPDQARKKKIVDYSSKYRAEAVKLLVLIAWAARADEVSTAIDLRAWLQGQKNCFDNLYASLRFDVLKNLESAKIIGPDIPSAVDILTTGSLPRLENSELVKAFQVKEALTVPDILKTLRTLDALISLRLLQHETLPAAMQEYQVGSGRATFTVANEFSIDLFFASEEVESPNLQWFMIDFRFAFTAEDAIDTPMSLKLEIENISNALLAKTLAEGAVKHQLVELFNFLHSFTIQYKLERLFSQFSIIGAREKGRIDVKYASVQKILVVGFWLSKRHREKKTVLNSFTIQISAELQTPKERFALSPRTSSDYNRDKLDIVVRLGDEEQQLGMSIEEHSATSLLSAVVQSRIGSLLKDIHQCLMRPTLPFTTATSTLQAKGLRIKLIREQMLTIDIDEYDGMYLVSLVGEAKGFAESVPSDMTERLQVALNSMHDPRDIAGRIHSFKVNYVKNDFERIAAAANWASVTFAPSSLFLSEFSTAFRTSDQATSVMPAACLFLTRNREGWKTMNADSSSWFIVVNFQPTALHVWLAEMSANERSSKWQIRWVQRLPLGPKTDHIPFDANLDVVFFDRLWRLSTARIISLQVSRSLGEHGIPHVYVKNHAELAWTSVDVPDVIFATDDIVHARVPWAASLMTFRIPSICRDSHGSSLVSFTCDRSPEHSFDLSTCQDDEFQLDGDKLCFEFMTRVADKEQSVLRRFYEKWEMLATIIEMVTATKRLKLPFHMQSLDSHCATFSYNDGKYLVQVQQHSTMPESGTQLLVTIGSTTTKHNPHLRIAHYLSSVATRFKDNMGMLFKVLILTLPVLEGLSQIEQQSYTNPECYIKVRSIGTYRIYYPSKSVALLIRARPAPKIDMLPEPYKKLANTTVWHFTDASKSSNPLPGQMPLNSCDKLFNEGLNDVLQTDLTFPEGTGIGCAPELASQVLAILHQTIIEDQPQPGAPQSDVSQDGKSKRVKKSRPETAEDNKAGQLQTTKKTDRPTAKKPRTGTSDSSNGHKQNSNEVIEIL